MTFIKMLDMTLYFVLQNGNSYALYSQQVMDLNVRGVEMVYAGCVVAGLTDR